MAAPVLSIVIPAYNEEHCIAKTVAEIIDQLPRLAAQWEVIVVDDGSTDRTGAIVREIAGSDGRVALVAAPHGGKGAAVKRGMLQARGRWRFIADADLSMPIRDLDRFLPAQGAPDADILIGSREARGAVRLAEPWHRHALGRLFNVAAKLLVVRGIEDTQCGFKLFSGEAAEMLFPLQRIDGFGFDVEILFLARRAGLSIREVPVTWTFASHSKVTSVSGAAGFVDLLKIRWNQICGRYRSLPLREGRSPSARRTSTEHTSVR